MHTSNKIKLFSAVLGSALAASAHAGEKTWDFETDPFEEFPFITSNQEELVWGGQGWDDWGADVDRAKRHSVDELLDKIFHEFKSSRIWILRKICETILLKLRKDACLASKESQAHLIS